jgi:hypothetical protein
MLLNVLQTVLVLAAISLCVVITIQGFTIRARPSALLLLAATVAALTTVNSVNVGLFTGTHLAGTLTAVALAMIGVSRERELEALAAD